MSPPDNFRNFELQIIQSGVAIVEREILKNRLFKENRKTFKTNELNRSPTLKAVQNWEGDKKVGGPDPPTPTPPLLSPPRSDCTLVYSSNENYDNK